MTDATIAFSARATIKINLCQCVKKKKKIFLTRVENTEDTPIPASPHTIASFFIDNWPSPDFVFRHPSYGKGVLIKANSHDTEIRPSSPHILMSFL